MEMKQNVSRIREQFFFHPNKRNIVLRFLDPNNKKKYFQIPLTQTKRIKNIFRFLDPNKKTFFHITRPKKKKYFSDSSAQTKKYFSDSSTQTKKYFSDSSTQTKKYFSDSSTQTKKKIFFRFLNPTMTKSLLLFFSWSILFHQQKVGNGNETKMFRNQQTILWSKQKIFFQIPRPRQKEYFQIPRPEQKEYFQIPRPKIKKIFSDSSTQTKKKYF